MTSCIAPANHCDDLRRLLSPEVCLPPPHLLGELIHLRQHPGRQLTVFADSVTEALQVLAYEFHLWEVRESFRVVKGNNKTQKWSNAMNIALFSDVHGHLRMLLHLVRNWQIAHSARLDATLIAGDLGCFPDPSKFDKATKRWSDRDPEEAGFAKYFTTPVAEVERLFVPELGEFSAVRCPILFVAGNHEDYDYLACASKQAPAPGAPPNTFPVDCYQRVHCVHDGSIVTIPGQRNSRLRIAGVWGIENARADAPYRIKSTAVQQLQERGKQSFDLLLTHDAPAEAYPLGGSALVTQIIRTNCPKIHLFGHVHPIHRRHEFSINDSPTKSSVLKDLSFGKDGRQGLVGSMGMLEWKDSLPRFEIESEDWLKQMRPRNWEQVWAEPVAA